MIKTYKLAQIIRDERIYPRHAVNDYNVRRLRDALVAGATLEPMVVAKESQRLIDGWHRYAAYEDLHGPDHKVQVEQISCASDAECFAEALRRNSRHGLVLSAYDQVRALQLGPALGLTVETVATCLSMTVDRAEELTIAKSARVGSESVALKGGLAHLKESQLTGRQWDGMQRHGGMSAVFYVNQLINLIEHDLLDSENSRLMERLHELALMIERVTVAVR